MNNESTYRDDTNAKAKNENVLAQAINYVSKRMDEIDHNMTEKQALIWFTLCDVKDYLEELEKQCLEGKEKMSKEVCERCQFIDLWVGKSPCEKCVHNDGSNHCNEEDHEPFEEIMIDGENEAVHHPDHYSKGRKYEPKDVIRDWDLNFNLGNAVKYISRAGRKGSKIEDLKKAIEYLCFEVEALKEE